MTTDGVPTWRQRPPTLRYCTDGLCRRQRPPTLPVPFDRDHPLAWLRQLLYPPRVLRIILPDELRRGVLVLAMPDVTALRFQPLTERTLGKTFLHTFYSVGVAQDSGVHTLTDFPRLFCRR